MKPFLTAALLVATSSTAHAAACDYKPSQLASLASRGLAAGVGMGTEAAKQAGHYALLHPGQSASAVGTAGGVVAGAAAQIGTVGAILVSPIAIAAGAIAGAGAALYEGACYFQVERITDPADVRRVLVDVAETDPRVALTQMPEGEVLRITNEDMTTTDYALDKLYIADGRLKVRQRLRNDDLGAVVLVAPETEASTGE